MQSAATLQTTYIAPWKPSDVLYFGGIIEKEMKKCEEREGGREKREMEGEERERAGEE